MNFPNRAYTSGDMTTPVACSLPVFEAPFPHTSARYVMRQDYIVNAEDFAATDLNTPHADPDLADYFLVNEGPQTELPGGRVRWTRTYAKIPDSWNDYELLQYRFIGLMASQAAPPYVFTNVEVDGRDPFEKKVTWRILHEYFMVGPSQTYATPADIPVNEQQEYTVSGDASLKVDYLVDITTNPLLYETSPSKPDYLAMVTAGTEIVAETSQPDRWMGNIWVRITRYVTAQ